jgi:hypothetical protein
MFLSFLEFQGPRKVEKLTIAVLMSTFFYVVFFNTMNTEQVEFAQTLLGLIPINANNEFYLFRQMDPSLQVVLPALLLKWGAHPVDVSVLMSLICQFVAFLAAAIGVFYLTNSSFFAFFSTFMFFGSFPDLHFYPFFFPTAFSAFGTLGMWFTLLVVFLYLLEFRKLGFFLAGLLASVHLGWFGAGLIYMIFFSLKYHPDRKQLLSFGLGLVISFSSFIIFKNFKENNFKESIYRTTDDFYPIDQLQWTSPTKTRNSERTTFELHNPNLITNDLTKSLQSLWSISSASFLLFLMAFILYEIRLIEQSKLRPLIIPFLLLYFVALAMLVWIELNDIFYLPSSITSALMRLIPNRYFNLSFAFLAMLSFSSLYRAFFKSWAFWVHILLIFFLFKCFQSPWKFLPMTFGVLIIYFASLKFRPLERLLRSL